MYRACCHSHFVRIGSCGGSHNSWRRTDLDGLSVLVVGCGGGIQSWDSIARDGEARRNVGRREAPHRRASDKALGVPVSPVNLVY